MSNISDFIRPSGGGGLNPGDIVDGVEFKNNYLTTTKVSLPGATYNIDLSLGNVFELEIDQPITISFSNFQAVGKSQVVVLTIRQLATGGSSVTWPNYVRWSPAGTAPTTTTRKRNADVFTFLVSEGGSNLYGTHAAEDVRVVIPGEFFDWTTWSESTAVTQDLASTDGMSISKSMTRGELIRLSDTRVLAVSGEPEVVSPGAGNLRYDATFFLLDVDPVTDAVKIVDIQPTKSYYFDQYPNNIIPLTPTRVAMLNTDEKSMSFWDHDGEGNGLKQTAFQLFNLPGGSWTTVAVTFGSAINATDPTGLTPGTDYDLNVTTGWYGLVPVVINGTDAQTFGDLVDLLNGCAPGVYCKIVGSTLQFTDAVNETDTLVIADGTTPLFASTTGFVSIGSNVLGVAGSGLYPFDAESFAACSPTVFISAGEHQDGGANAAIVAKLITWDGTNFNILDSAVLVSVIDTNITARNETSVGSLRAVMVRPIDATRVVVAWRASVNFDAVTFFSTVYARIVETDGSTITSLGNIVELGSETGGSDWEFDLRVTNGGDSVVLFNIQTELLDEVFTRAASISGTTLTAGASAVLDSGDGYWWTEFDCNEFGYCIGAQALAVPGAQPLAAVVYGGIGTATHPENTKYTFPTAWLNSTSATNLANDATQYTIDVFLNELGVAETFNISITGSTAQTWDDLATQINAQLTGRVSFKYTQDRVDGGGYSYGGGTASYWNFYTTGPSATVQTDTLRVADGNLFSSLVAANPDYTIDVPNPVTTVNGGTTTAEIGRVYTWQVEGNAIVPGITHTFKDIDGSQGITDLQGGSRIDDPQVIFLSEDRALLKVQSEANHMIVLKGV